VLKKESLKVHHVKISATKKEEKKKEKGEYGAERSTSMADRRPILNSVGGTLY